MAEIHLFHGDVDVSGRLRDVVILRLVKAFHVRRTYASHHNVLPSFACRAPEKQHYRVPKVLEVVVPVDVCIRVERDFPENLRKI